MAVSTENSQSILIWETGIPESETKSEIDEEGLEHSEKHAANATDDSRLSTPKPTSIPKSVPNLRHLFPPFMQGKRKHPVEEEEDHPTSKHRSAEPPEAPPPPREKTFRTTICIPRHKYPPVCKNVPEVCGVDVPVCGAQDPICFEPVCDSPVGPISGHIDSICGEPSICRGTSVCGETTICRAPSICGQTTVRREPSVCGKTSICDETSVLEIECGESVDYVICESDEEEQPPEVEPESEMERDGNEVPGSVVNEYTDEEYEINVIMPIPPIEEFQDPLMSHRLAIPYDEMPASRYFQGGPEKVNFSPVTLVKRPKSPVRHLLPGRYDVVAGREALMARIEEHNTRKYIAESKELITDIITARYSEAEADTRSQSFLQVILEEVNLTILMDESFADIDDFFVTLATIWAMFGVDPMESTPATKRTTSVSTKTVIPKVRRPPGIALGPSRSRISQRIPQGGYPSRGTDYMLSHRTLPWGYVCAAHARGLPSTYVNVRDCIDDVTSSEELKLPRAAYMPDVTCPHLKVLPRKMPIIPEPANEPPEKFDMLEEFLMQLFSFM